jgi:DNA-binding Lrp family transcriptional regulator
MPTRFEIERAVMKSKLLSASRHLMHVLCTHVDAKTDMILPEYQPSLTDLAKESGLHRRTVTRHLAHLEHAGWIIRVRPTLSEARKDHKRTNYVLLKPEGSYPQPRVTAAARDTTPSDLGASRPPARGPVPQRFSSTSSLSGGVEPPTPVPPNYNDRCKRCSRVGHAADECEE